MVSSFVECRLGIIRDDQPLKTTCESYVIDGPVLFGELGDIAFVHVSVRVRYGETIAIADGTAERCLSEAAYPHRWVGSLDGFRGYLDMVEVEEFVLEGDGLSIEKTANDPESFVGTLPALLERDTEAFELFDFVANSDTEFETSARNDINHGDILSKAHGIVKRH